MKAANKSIPTFKLYGEVNNWLTPDLLHCESIADRSQLHDWTIKPHRHTSLLQLLYVKQGSGTAQLDGHTYPIHPPCLLLIPELCIHGFTFANNIEGHVLSLASPLTRQLHQQLGPRQTTFLEAACYAVEPDSPYLNTLFETLDREYRQLASGRELLLQSLVTAVAVWISRRAIESASQQEQANDKGSQHFALFSQLLEQYYKSHQPIEDYARGLGITAPHLNSICRRFTEHSALQLVHDRLLLEAKRSLIYTVMTISEVSETLGFSEPAYFSRFFKRYTATTPKAFRQNSNRYIDPKLNS